MKKRNKSKKAEEPIGMSFSMIVSVLLMVFFVVIAFIAIRYFIKLQNCSLIGNFADEFQAKVTDAWNSQKADSELKKILPSGIEYICFADLSKNLKGENKAVVDELEYFHGSSSSNMFFYPKDKSCNMPSLRIKHLDMEKITSSKNPYCIAVENGKINIKIQKDFIEELVTISCMGVNCTSANILNQTFYSRRKATNFSDNYSISKTEPEEKKTDDFNAVQFCSLINDSEDRRICTNAVQSQKQGDSLAKATNQCDNLADINAKNSCYWATKTNYNDLNNIGSQRDLALCNQFTDPTSRYLCERHILANSKS
ncbi:MAG: hypothetical protein AABX54_02585 [Nanoarchaeota archaeon]